MVSGKSEARAVNCVIAASEATGPSNKWALAESLARRRISIVSTHDEVVKPIDPISLIWIVVIRSVTSWATRFGRGHDSI